jgi:hypothetical protein
MIVLAARWGIGENAFAGGIDHPGKPLPVAHAHEQRWTIAWGSWLRLRKNITCTMSVLMRSTDGMPVTQISDASQSMQSLTNFIIAPTQTARTFRATLAMLGRTASCVDAAARCVTGNAHIKSRMNQRSAAVRRQLLKECQNISSLELTANNHIAICIDAMDLKNRLRDIEADSRYRLHDLAPPNHGVP